ncbi:beta-aspartyl-peptidase [Kangiella profundi]|uniref:Isoaspartyl peptidase n=1 Tax=Kangiella profundi TaxID=1561924 RepID=A0A2K9B2R2_9GAMM|nr:isoaspartyl peptidase/L-asparaginase [Kangiella profundi]AUD79208.1 beta-aspartyl-peptidase [Kangiella profundi]GGF00577.1 isoaspartyl peptidase/L-asparaginase [Kangiella profundi]
MIKQTLTALILIGGLASGVNAMDSSDKAKSKTAIVIHGGAGTILKSKMTPEIEQAYIEALTHALKTGHQILKEGGSSTEAVKATIVTMEDSPLFNAGKGAVFTHEGKNELDASIMVSSDRSAGAVAGVSHIKNPILLADKVRTDSKHVLMAREGAEAFAKEQGFDMVDPKYFFTQNRWDQLQKILKETPDKMQLSEDEAKNSKFGTVGAVALDMNGVITAGTSTGGMTNKRYGRIGDSPIIGAGTYANEYCGISATGHGEYFIRAAVAYDICALVEYKGESIQSAADIVIQEKLKTMGGDGGVIGLDKDGNIMMSFNTPGMYRGSIDVDGNITIEIYQEH